MLFWHFFRHLIFSPRAGALIRRIALLSTVAIFLSSLAFLLVLFVMSGMNESIQTRILSLEPHAVLTILDEKKTPASELEKLPAIEALKSQPGAAWTSFESQDVIIRTLDGQFRGVPARGLDRQGLARFEDDLRRLEEKNASTRISPSPRWQLGPDEVILGIDLARSLALFEGDLLLILPPEALLMAAGEAPKAHRVRIRRIVATQLADLDSGLFLYDREQSMMQFRGSASRREGWEFRWADGTRADRLKAQTGEIPGVRFETWSERNSALFFALRMEKLMIGMFLALAGLIAASSILTVMALLLSQKRRDLALLRVLGLPRLELIRLFTKVGLVLAAVGILSGLTVGTALGLWIEAHPFDVLPDIYYDSQVPARVELRWILMVLFGAGAVAALGSWIPSRVASSLEPTEVLRQKN